MTVGGRSFLPDSLRPQPRAAPRSRRGPRLRVALAVLVLAGALWLAGTWRVDAVSLQTCAGLPASAAEDLRALRGEWVPAVDLHWVRRQVERWPGVGAVDVELRLPGTLVVRATDEGVCASFPVASGWRAVACDGSPGRRIERPRAPVLLGFGGSASELRRGLAVGRRLAGAAGERVARVRRVTPTDFEVALAGSPDGRGPAVLRVLPDGSPGEAWWLRERAAGRAPRWADLRFTDRVVVGGGR
jgi:hypothetical protein